MDEYISRNGVLFATMQRGINVAAMEVVRDYPAADVSPVVHGRWIRIKGVTPCCSICGGCVEEQYHYPYCPNCGAKMDGGDECATD